ncbi:MAG: hypothetical protein PHW32_04405 [Bacilli bacterium]|nr:hypothetical protein [Bacilli bacterium]MDD4719177.1 hypothetical protein [Bacilli bacterium]
MAKKNKEGVWIDVNNDAEKGHVNIYDRDPRGEHNSTHINIDYEKGTFNINEKTDGDKTTTEGNCYLTSACIKHFREKFNDDCEELTILRNFRDSFVSKEDIDYYYSTAPIIVEGINKIENNNSIYSYIYQNVVKVCVNAIKNGDYQFAYNRYKSSVLTLEEQFARPLMEQQITKVLKPKTN